MAAHRRRDLRPDRPPPDVAGAVGDSADHGLSSLSWLVSEPSFARLLLVLLWFSFIFGTYNGALIPFLTEMMPPLVRTSGFSLAFSVATALFGGLTPAIATYLIHATENRAMPGAWLSVAAILALGSAWTSRPYVLPEPTPTRAVA